MAAAASGVCSPGGGPPLPKPTPAANFCMAGKVPSLRYVSPMDGASGGAVNRAGRKSGHGRP